MRTNNKKLLKILTNRSHYDLVTGLYCWNCGKEVTTFYSDINFDYHVIRKLCPNCHKLEKKQYPNRRYYDNS